MPAATLPIAPPVTFNAAREGDAYRGEIIQSNGERAARTHHLHATVQAALQAADRLWKSLRAQAAEVDL
ncbi:hypothetical protein [Dyella japonica]|uniref:Uncharacterized protein n=1 Tax=Dyella japonica TaxID=231455 RepID=A0ABV2JUI4_9GAMM